MNIKQQYTKCDFCRYKSGRTCMAKPDSHYCKDALNEFYAWLKNKGKGCVEGCTGYGKTRIGLNAIETVRKRYPELSVIVVVPTDVLRNQWLEQLDERGLGWNCKVEIINTASKTIDQCDLLILDDIGVERGTPWTQERLYDLLNTRYNECKCTIFTSNLGPTEIEDKLGTRIASRIRSSKIIELKGVDRRG